MSEEVTILYVAQRSPIIRACLLVLTVVYLAFLISFGRTLPPMEVSATVGVVALMAWAWASVFIRRTLFTEEGVEYRTSFGTKRFGRWHDVVVLERKGKVLTIGFGNTGLKLTKAEADLDRLAEVLRNRAAQYGYDV